ncbi:MAG: ribonuclease T [Sphingomonadaceae bacterium]
MRAASAFILSALVFPAAANAQALSCRLPDSVPQAEVESGPSRVVPIGGYTLALSWSPEYCRFREKSGRDDFQCSRPTNRFGFVLHGLWPDGTGGRWPQYCRKSGPLPPPVVRATLCTMPSVDLQQHQWAKHGTCAFRDPGAYFWASRKLFSAVRYPDMSALSRSEALTVADFAAAFVARNPGIGANMIRVDVNRRGGLEEVMLCLDTHFRPSECRTGRADRDHRVVRIWRGGR